MQISASATLNNACFLGGNVYLSIKIKLFITLRHLFKVGLISLVLSYWENCIIDGNQPE